MNCDKRFFFTSPSLFSRSRVTDFWLVQVRIIENNRRKKLKKLTTVLLCGAILGTIGINIPHLIFPAMGDGIVIAPDKGTSSIEMIEIPAGNFLMGSLESDIDASDHEKPQHTVYLNSYQISKYEVTVGQFKQFVKMTGYQTDAEREGWGHGYNTTTRTFVQGKYSWKTPGFKQNDNHPVVCISWNDAAAFCSWAGGRLPTEAEWEKAARGTDGRKYPWGNNTPECNLLNFWGYNVGKQYCVSSTTVTGSYPAGASPYGVMDMAGNVWEWCNDWYNRYYYSSSPTNNPQGPNSGLYRVMRGGRWGSSANTVRCGFRDIGIQTDRSDGLGMRFVK